MMNRIKTYKIFESSSEDMDEIREVFTDSDLEEKNIDVVYVTEEEGVQVSLNKDIGRVGLEGILSILMPKEEYVKLHNLIMSKITYLDDVGVECVNVIYCMMDEKYEKTYKSLTEYFGENVDMNGFLKFLYGDDGKQIAMIMLYFRFR